MTQFANSNKTKRMQTFQENQLSPIKISGLIIPWEKRFGDEIQSDYMLMDGHGDEYLILQNSEVSDLLSLYCWKEVKIVGLLNKSDKTLIPQKVFPKGPDGESSNVIDLSLRKKQSFKRALNKVNEWVVVPAAILAVLAS